jgi:hypothetical protein
MELERHVLRGLLLLTCTTEGSFKITPSTLWLEKAKVITFAFSMTLIHDIVEKL